MPRRLRHDDGSASTTGRPYVTADLNPYALPPRSWAEVQKRYLDVGRPMAGTALDVVESIIDCGGAERLIGGTSMFDLNIAPRPRAGPASGLDMLTVCTIGSMYSVADGEVLMRHRAPSGRLEEMRRPAAEAVALFWRLATEKWGVAPWRWDVLTEGQRGILEQVFGGAPGPRPASTAPSSSVAEDISTLRRLGLLRPKASAEPEPTAEAQQWWCASHGGSLTVTRGADPG